MSIACFRPRILSLVVLLGCASSLSGCVSTAVGVAVGTTAAVGKAAVGTTVAVGKGTVKAGGAVVDAVTPDGDEEEDRD